MIFAVIPHGVDELRLGAKTKDTHQRRGTHCRSGPAGLACRSVVDGDRRHLP